MALTGDFREIRFAELLRRYEQSRESVAVLVRLRHPSGPPDGVFHFAAGELVDATLEGTEGREALRRVLRLREGAFSVAAFAQASARSPSASWRAAVREELARAEAEEGPSPGRATPGPAPRPSRRGTRIALLAFLVLGGAAFVTIATLVLLLLSPAGRRADEAVQALLEPAPPAGRGIAADELRLGIAAPFTGANRELGQGMKAGLEAAFAEVNAAGGVHGRRLRLVAEDDGYEPSRTGPAVRALVQREQVFALVGNVGTPTAAVALPYCAQQRVILFGALSGGDLLRKRPPDPHVFNFRPSYADETAAAVRWLVGARRVDPRRIAVFAQEDEFGAAGWRGVARQLEAYGVESERIARVGYRRNGADVEDAVAALRARAGAVDAVVMVATYRAAAAFIRATQEAGLSLVYTNVSAVDSTALGADLAATGGRRGRDVLVTQIVPPFGTGAPVERRYRDALARHAPSERPGTVSLEGFVVGSLLVEGLRRAGRELDTDKLVAVLEAMHGVDLGLGAPVGFAPGEHQASRRVWGTLLQRDGTCRPVDLEDGATPSAVPQRTTRNSSPR